jgi:MFS family permease
MLSACLMAVGVGTALAWTSPVLPQLYEETSWLVITKEQGSWISSLLALGAIAGAVPSGPMSDKLGRKKTLLLLTIPFVLSWAIIIFTSKLWLIYVARFLVGIAVGAACVVVPTYITEIAETSIRGTLGAMFQLFLTVGILLAFIFGSVTNYTAFAIICGLINVGFLASFMWMPESPIWLVVGHIDNLLQFVLFIISSYIGYFKLNFKKQFYNCIKKNFTKNF